MSYSDLIMALPENPLTVMVGQLGSFKGLKCQDLYILIPILPQSGQIKKIQPGHSTANIYGGEP